MRSKYFPLSIIGRLWTLATGRRWTSGTSMMVGFTSKRTLGDLDGDARVMPVRHGRSFSATSLETECEHSSREPLRGSSTTAGGCVFS